MGIDDKIKVATDLFTARLWTGKTNIFKGRAFVIEGKPHEYLGNNDYKPLAVDDRYASGCFFVVEPNRTLLIADVTIHFFVNLTTMYGATTRETEQAHNDVYNILKFTDFQISELITDKESMKNLPTFEIHNMQPFYLFAFKTKNTYKINNC